MCCVVADKPYSESKTVIVMFLPNGSLSAVLSIAKAMNWGLFVIWYDCCPGMGLWQSTHFIGGIGNSVVK